jgi:hypothetical protein
MLKLKESQESKMRKFKIVIEVEDDEVVDELNLDTVKNSYKNELFSLIQENYAIAIKILEFTELESGA